MGDERGAAQQSLEAALGLLQSEERPQGLWPAFPHLPMARTSKTAPTVRPSWMVG